MGEHAGERDVGLRGNFGAECDRFVRFYTDAGHPGVDFHVNPQRLPLLLQPGGFDLQIWLTNPYAPFPTFSHARNLGHGQFAFVFFWILLQEQAHVGSLWLHFQ